MELYLKKQLSIALILYAGQIMVGFSLGWTAPIVPKLQDPDATPLPSVISPGQASWIGSLLYIGSILGPYVSGYLSNVQGRRPCLVLGGVLTLLSFLILALAQNISMIYAGRICSGLGTGIIFVTNLVYIGEIASTNLRGVLLTGTGIFSTLGTLLVYSVGPFVPYSVTSYVGLFITFIYVLGLIAVPESPMFYILHEKEYEAKKTLKALGREEDAEKLIIVKVYRGEQKNEWKDLYRVKSNRRAFVITFTLGILQQLSGIIVVTFFATTIFETAGSSIEPHIATIIIGCTQVASSAIAPVFVERRGRKLLMLVSSALCCFSLGTLGTYFFLDHYDYAIVHHVKWMPLFTLMIFFLSFDMGQPLICLPLLFVVHWTGFGIIPGTFIGEMFASNIRSYGSALTITSAWIFGFAVATAFGSMMDNIGGFGTFWLFSAACAVAFVFTAVYVPETKGKSLVEIQEMLSK